MSASQHPTIKRPTEEDKNIRAATRKANLEYKKCKMMNIPDIDESQIVWTSPTDADIKFDREERARIKRIDRLLSK